MVGSLSKTKWEEIINVNGTNIRFKLDTGAQASTLSLSQFKALKEHPGLRETKTILIPFGGGNKIKPVGVVSLQCSVNNNVKELPFHIVQGNVSPILSQDACESLDLVKRVNITDVSKATTLEDITQKYAANFHGTGKYEKEYSIVTDPNVQPVVQPARKIPFSKLELLKRHLTKLEEQNIIAPVDKPTDWVSNLVITEKKNGKLRICLDPKPLNRAIKRERHTIPTAADVSGQLAGKSIYTVLDMADGFWHVALDEASSYLCTFNSPWGRKRFLRMPFGISSASEVMQKRNEETFGDIPGVHIVADDMIVAAANEKEHDAILERIMQRAQEKNVRFNKSKVQFKVSTVKYLGNLVASSGLRPDPEKVRAISEMPVPSDRTALQRLLGMVKFLSQYIPDESSITAPLRSLLKKNVAWQWQPEHQQAVEKIKHVLASNPVLGFYDVTKDVTIQADASQAGLGACLIQENRPIAYASRALTDTEKRYAQIEKELLAICFACQRFHQYIYGKTVNVQSDHKPLEAIYLKPIGNATP